MQYTLPQTIATGERTGAVGDNKVPEFPRDEILGLATESQHAGWSANTHYLAKYASADLVPQEGGSALVESPLIACNLENWATIWGFGTGPWHLTDGIINDMEEVPVTADAEGTWVSEVKGTTSNLLAVPGRVTTTSGTTGAVYGTREMDPQGDRVRSVALHWHPEARVYGGGIPFVFGEIYNDGITDPDGIVKDWNGADTVYHNGDLQYRGGWHGRSAEHFYNLSLEMKTVPVMTSASIKTTPLSDGTCIRFIGE